MKTKRGFYVLAMALAVAFLWVATASAAIDRVRCIVWQGDPAKHHTAISGETVRLKGVITTTDTSQIWYRWDYGDGSLSSVYALSGSTKYNVSIDKASYTGSDETPFTAKLLVDDVDNSMANAVEDTYLLKIQADTLDARVNIAIDNGLWWLYTNPYSYSYFHTFDGSPFMVWRTGTGYTNYYTGSTASTIQAFAINNHKINGDTTEDPYVESVQLGMKWLIQGYYASGSYPMLNAVSIGGQTAGDPDTNGNGYGVQAHDYGSRMIYQGGQVMDAIIASGVQPTDLTERDFSRTDGMVVKNWTYGELLQDMCDMYAWGQVDSSGGSHRGGWRYGWNYQSDNSAAQWAAIGMIPAQKAPWNCTVPGWVKTENQIWLNNSYNGTGFGYTGPGSGYGTTPSGMVQMNMDGLVGYDDPLTLVDERDSKWITAERWLADNYAYFLSSNQYYGWYSFAKAMRTALPSPVERITTSGAVSFDWYNGSGSYKGMAQRIIEVQDSAGQWNALYTGWGALGTAWNIIILKPVLFAAAPIACFDVNPNPSYPDFPIIFDPTCSDHSETGKDIGNIVLFEWDWDNDGVYDESTATPEDAVHPFSCAILPCEYPVTLRVTDDEGLTAKITRKVEITNPPHPPVAEAGGPYMVSLCDGDSLVLDGSGSFDPNEGEAEDGCTTCPPDTIIAWDWDLSAPLTDFDDETGEVVTLDSAEIAGYFGAGLYNIGLRVTDNTELAFPSSPDTNLTDSNFATVMVFEGCEPCIINARVKGGLVQLTWTHSGAASYDIYRSTEGPNSGFELIADDHVTTYATYLDLGLTNGTTYYYRVVSSDGCGSAAVSATPIARPTRTR